MRVVIKPPTEFEANEVKVDEKEKSIAVKPSFFQAKGKAVAGLIEAISEDGKVAFRGVLYVNGKTGFISIDQRTKVVTPELDKKGKK